ncbi:APG6-domain-containing protein [Rhizodiscina lignyota]|uniref:APG6-domain-containing protein n=1 Tax=Rhizodiscina lignyota TaxID=1504668 RepID=A0A9P4IH91_9PEZI|nr:APG6-domain-containing protein [Rhizodiscina lignyota]
MFCQQCRTPIRLDDSLDDLNPAAFKLLTEATNPTSPPTSSFSRSSRTYPEERKHEYQQLSQQARSPAVKRTVHSNHPQSVLASQALNQRHQNPAMSFVMLTESQVVPQLHDQAHDTKVTRNGTQHISQPAQESESLLSQKMETTARLFETMSARSDIDHPICVECTEMLVEGLQKQLAGATKERDAYIEFLRQANADIPTDEEVQQAEMELKEAQDREAAAFVELEQLEKEKAALDDELLALEAESLDLDKEEEKFWANRNAFSTTLASFQNERDRLNARFDHDSKQLLRLQRTNVFNDIFCIGHDGYFATINNLRLGRLPDKTVDWAEINAALGQTCLLLATVAEKLGFIFKGYELKPLGSTSVLYKIETPQSVTGNDPSHVVKSRREFPLFNSGDLTFGLVGFHAKFDQAMVHFLECVRQLGEHMENTPVHERDGSTSPGVKLPYIIEKGKINEVSIKLGFNQEESWTKGCKYLLTCCKFLLAHSSNINGAARRVT